MTTRMNCGKCGKPMKAELIWLSSVFIGSRLVPAFHCVNKKCQEHRDYVRHKRAAKK